MSSEAILNGLTRETELAVLYAREEASFAVHSQWVFSHVGVSGNEREESLSARAHDDLPTLKSLSDYLWLQKQVRLHI